MFIAGLAIAPLWFGGNRPAAWAVNSVWASGLATFYELRVLSDGGVHPVAMRLVWPAALAFVATVVWCVIQVSQIVPDSFQHPIWDAARKTLMFNVAGSVSVNREASLLALLRLVTAACVFWLALQLCRSSRRAKLTIAAIALIGFAYASYGLIAFFAFPETILWMKKTDYLDALTATFINRNSYATYAALGLIAAVGVVLKSFAASAAEQPSARHVADFIANVIGPAGAWIGIAAVITIALMLTGSRGGITSAFFGLFVGLILAIVHKRGRRSPAVIASIAVLFIFAAVTVVFGDLLAERLATEGLRSDDRIAVYRMVLTSIADRPVLGFGYGTFEHVFPMYRDQSISPLFRWDKAHNTYLEVIQGLGIPMSVVLFAGVGSLVWRCFFGALNRRRFSIAPLVASAASATVLAHAFVDFSLQIQGVTLTWMALLGSGVAQSWSSQASTDLA